MRPVFSTFAALLALLLQVFAVQTHIDGVAGARADFASASFGQSVRTAPPEIAAPPEELQAACPLCQALASGATSLAASSPSLELAFGAVAEAALVAALRARAPPAHPWQSRAPPTFL